MLDPPAFLATGDGTYTEAVRGIRRRKIHKSLTETRNELAIQAQSGDLDALARLITEHCDNQIEDAVKSVVTVGGRLGRELRENARADVNAQILEKFHYYDFRADVCTWMVSVAINKAIDTMRKNARWSGIIQQMQERFVVEDGDVPELAAIRNFCIDALKANLSEEDMNLLLMKALPMTFEEVGKVLGVSKEAARKRHQAAMKRAERVLDKSDG